MVTAESTTFDHLVVGKDRGIVWCIISVWCFISGLYVLLVDGTWCVIVVVYIFFLVGGRREIRTAAVLG